VTLNDVADDQETGLFSRGTKAVGKALRSPLELCACTLQIPTPPEAVLSDFRLGGEHDMEGDQ
jgi:hypothetical protein